ncbi:MAG: DUF2156 domain-containing protein [Clostridia bacterium]|nr:DUF2156 domain-containing protein [Clostridia bacterium]
MIEFKDMDLECKSLFEEYFGGKYENSETSFANLYMWKDYYKTCYSLVDGFLVILNTSPSGKLHCYMPYGNGDMEGCLKAVRDYTLSKGQPLRITSASESDAENIRKIFPEVDVKENTSFNDYVYLAENLVNLSGKKLHSKRNHLNKFKATYDYVYREMVPEDFEPCLELAGRLMRKTRSEESFGYMEELKSIETAFDNFELFKLSGGVIEIDGNIAAFTVGEKLTQNCALIHIEKADTSYDGIYAAINNEFVKNRWADFEFVNREEDMGIPGLRKAKLSYRPHHMVRKFLCII